MQRAGSDHAMLSGVCAARLEFALARGRQRVWRALVAASLLPLASGR